ncbi:MAG: M20/M25/M40 family metallo-hydrolase, partial [Erysipelotrichaceae bacterium]
ETVVRRMDKDIQTELEYSDAGFFVEFKETISDTVFTDEVSSSVIDALYLAPNGFQARSMAIEGLTQTSLNLGVLDSNDGKVTAEFSIRSAIGCSIDDFISRLSVVARVCGFEVEQDSRYPNWSYSKDSPMRDAFNEIVLERTGKPLELHAGHGGNECGVFKALNPKMDIVSMGPITQFIHTPDEKMDLASFDRTFENLKTMITRLK